MLKYVDSVPPSAATANDLLSTYTYDALGRPTDVTHDDGQSIHYGYDATGNRIGMRTEINGTLQTYVTYQHDALNRVTEVNDHDPALVTFDPDEWLTNTGAATTTLQYNPLGQMTTIARPNDVTTTYTYGDIGTVVDPLNNYTENPYQVYEINHSHSTTGLISDYQYSYDPVGNRTDMTVTTPDGMGTDVDTYSYDYDRANRLIQEIYNPGNADLVTEYRYDRAGNRTQMINGDGITSYTYSANDELTRVDLPDYYFEDYTYDARGNLTLFEAGGHGTYSAINYAYNARDQLTSYGTGGTPVVTYAYDNKGYRTDMTVASSNTNYLWDEFSQFGDVILETNPTNTIGYTLVEGMLVSQTNNGNVDYFLQDAQNSTIALADQSGVVEDYHRYSYNAFGELQYGATQNSINLGTSYLYTGQQFDAIYSELYNLRARQYDPSLGRFLTRDTWAYDYGNPIELNRYVYTSNNPVNYSDPSGHWEWAFTTGVRGSSGVTEGELLGAINFALWSVIGISILYMLSQVMPAYNPPMPGLGGTGEWENPLDDLLQGLENLKASLSNEFIKNTVKVIAAVATVACVASLAISAVSHYVIPHNGTFGVSDVLPDNCEMNQVRIQVQEGHANTIAIVAANRADPGVTGLQVKFAMTQLYQMVQSTTWFRWNRYHEALMTGFILAGFEVDRFVQAGGVRKENFNFIRIESGPYTTTNGQRRNLDLGNYRIDIENMHGWNLKR